MLEARSRWYTLSCCNVVRMKIVLLVAEGFENIEIGERLDTPQLIVNKWRKRFFHECLANLDERPCRGGPSGFSLSGHRARESNYV